MQVLGAPASFIKQDDWQLVAAPQGSSDHPAGSDEPDTHQYYDGQRALDLTALSAPALLQSIAQSIGPLLEPRNCDGATGVSVTHDRRVLKLDTGGQP